MTSFQNLLMEIKWRFFYLIFSTICTFFIFYSSSIESVYLVGKPFLEHQQTFIFLGLTEAFYTLLKISLFFTLFLIFPLSLYSVWSFLVPSSYKSERPNLTFFFQILFFLFISEIVISSFFLFPKMCDFLVSFEMTSQPLNSVPVITVEFVAQIGSYSTLIFKFFTGIFFLFQIPIGICFLYSQNLLDVSWFALNRKLGVFFSLILSSLLVPPDVLIQFLGSFFFLFLFEVLIFLGFFFHEHKKNH